MAKTSEYALNLLDELRSRNERIAATNSIVADAYASNSKTAYKSSKEPKTLKTTGFRAGNTQNRPSGVRKSVTAASAASNQIVPFGRGRMSEKNGSLSMTLAFVGRTNSSGNGPMFKLSDISHLRIEDILRGVQKLNQILRDCSKGLKFDRYSIDIGGELLKGAMDLEESFRMLVNLRDDEKQLDIPRLLDEDKDDDDEKQLDIPRFSFGRASRNYNDIQGVARPDLKLRLKELTYSSEGTNFKHGEKVLAGSNSHPRKQSVGYRQEQNHSSSLQCKEEKLRIPNVIAKLMGIDELPGNVDSKVTTKESRKKPGKIEIIPMTSSRKASIKIGKQQSDQQKLHSNHGFEKVRLLQKSDLREKRRQLEERKQQISNQKVQGKQKGNEPKCSNLSKTKSGANATSLQKKQTQMNQAAANRKGSREHIDATHEGRHHKNQADDWSSTNLNNKIQGLLNRSSRHSRRDQESESAKEVDRKPVQVQTKMKARSTKGSNLEVHRTNEAMKKKGASVYYLSKTPKDQSSILQERKQTRLEKLAVSRESSQMKACRFEEVAPKVIRSNKSIASIQSSSVAQEKQKAVKQDPVLCSLVKDERGNLNKPQALVRKDSGQNSVPMVTNEQKDQEPDFGRAEESKFVNIASDPLYGTNEANAYEKPQNQRTNTTEMPEPLTENKIHFKQILTKSQLFTNTEETHFKRDSPISIHHGNVHNYNEQESKLVLDCGYEVMQRKERRQQLSAHPFLNLSIITSSKAKSFDDLAKPIGKDIDKLKLYGKEGKEDCPLEDYLLKMVEADVNDNEPDLNCMWDMGWNCKMFACLEKDDVISDVEKYVLNGLLIGITRDLFTAISASA